MGSRGRRSQAAIAASKSVVVQGVFRQRHDPPEDLTEIQGKIWRETVASENDEVFTTAATRAMLKDYCRHRADADRLSVVLNQFKTEWLKTGEGIKRYRELSRERGEEVYRAARMATKLRMTNQSRYTPEKAATRSRHMLEEMPWDDEVGEEVPGNARR